MTFDPRPLERISSLMMVGVVVFMALMFGAVGFVAGLVSLFDYPVVGLGIWCVGLPPIPVGAVALLWLLRWTRCGSVASYVASLEAALGVSGTLEGASMLYPLLTPEWAATVDGRAVRVRMRRTAGLLSPLSPAGGLGVPWTLEAFVDGEGSSAKVGFTHPKAATLGMGLLGLSNPVKKEAVQVFVGSRPELAENELVVATASELTYGTTTLVSVGPEGLASHDRRKDLPAEALAEGLRTMMALLDAVESASP